MVLNFLRRRFTKHASTKDSTPKLIDIATLPARKRVYAGRILPVRRQPRRHNHHHPRPCKTTAHIISHLKALVKGFNRLEASQDDLSRLETGLANAFEFSLDGHGRDERVERVYKSVRLTEGTITKNLEDLEVLVMDLAESLEYTPKSVDDDDGDEEEENQPPKLPIYLTDQIRRVDNAREIYASSLDLPNTPQGFTGELEILNRVYTVMQRGRNVKPKRGWHETENFYEKMMERRDGILKRERMVQACREKLKEELRGLCRDCAPRALTDGSLV